LANAPRQITAENELARRSIKIFHYKKLIFMKSEAVQMYSRRNGRGIWFRGQ
jgi:hypothetical protein